VGLSHKTSTSRTLVVARVAGESHGHGISTDAGAGAGGVGRSEGEHHQQVAGCNEERGQEEQNEGMMMRRIFLRFGHVNESGGQEEH
jgi:hypothetical protein